MDCGARCGGGWLVEALPSVVKSGSSGCKVSRRFGVPFRNAIVGSVNFQAAVLGSDRQFTGTRNRPRLTVKATSAEYNKCDSRYIGSPLEPQSSTGILLKSILKNQPYIFRVTVAKELGELAYDRESANARMERSLGSSEACLHRRIAELKEHECQSAVEEVMYMLIVHSFSKLEVPMVPRLANLGSCRTIDIWPSKDLELESIHSPEILYLVKEHLLKILDREARQESSVNLRTTEIKRLQLGRLYASSIVYGYFLKSASLRLQLERCIAHTAADFPLGCTICVPHLDRHLSNLEENPVPIRRPFDVVSALSPGIDRLRKPKKLREYLTDFDAKAIQLCARFKSQEAVNLSESHCMAVFGDGNINTLNMDDIIVVTLAGLKRLVLEAVAFGTFLWDAERFVEPIYRLKEHQRGARW